MAKLRSLDILVVDDNPADGHLLFSVFTSIDPGHTWTVLTCGAEALSLLRRRHTEGQDFPDLLLLDVNLPRQSGWTSSSASRTMRTCAGCPS